jgi:hypothetical protein
VTGVAGGADASWEQKDISPRSVGCEGDEHVQGERVCVLVRTMLIGETGILPGIRRVMATGCPMEPGTERKRRGGVSKKGKSGDI